VLKGTLSSDTVIIQNTKGTKPHQQLVTSGNHIIISPDEVHSYDSIIMHTVIYHTHPECKAVWCFCFQQLLEVDAMVELIVFKLYQNG